MANSARNRRLRFSTHLALTLALFVLPGNSFSANAQNSLSGYHVIKTVPVGGDGFWDYMSIDSDARRLYISHGNHITVMDTDSYGIVGEIDDTKMVHGAALAPDLGRGFTSNGGTNTATIFELKTLKPLGTAETGKGPDAVIYDPASHRAFTFNGEAGTSTVIDGASGAVVGTIDLGGRPEFAVADGEGHVYNNLEDKSIELEIDSHTLKINHRWPLAPCESPSGVAMDKEHRRLFVGCHNKMMAIVNADTGKVVATVPIGQGVDANAFDPGTQLAFSSNGDGSLTVVHEDSPNKYTLVENVTTKKSARTMAIDLKTHTAFLAAADLGPPAKGQRWPSIKPGSFVILVVAK
jgi:DNA-binding beta-propeller fold protein YncE